MQRKRSTVPTSTPPQARAPDPPRGPALATLRGTVAEVHARQSPDGVSLVILRIIILRPGKSGEAVDEFEISSWGQLAEKTAQHLRVGEVVTIRARLTTNWWSDSRGRRQHSMKLTAQEITR